MLSNDIYSIIRCLYIHNKIQLPLVRTTRKSGVVLRSVVSVCLCVCVCVCVCLARALTITSIGLETSTCGTQQHLEYWAVLIVSTCRPTRVYRVLPDEKRRRN